MLGCWPMMAVSIMQTLQTGSVLSGPQRLSASLASYRPFEGNHIILYDITPQRPKTLSMEDYVGLLAYDGSFIKETLQTGSILSGPRGFLHLWPAIDH